MRWSDPLLEQWHETYSTQQFENAANAIPAPGQRPLGVSVIYNRQQKPRLAIAALRGLLDDGAAHGEIEAFGASSWKRGLKRYVYRWAAVDA